MRPAPAVVVHAVESMIIAPANEYIARVEALEAVDLRARVSGFIEEIPFKPGAYLKQGDLLFKIEPALYEAAVAAAQAQLSRAVAARTQAANTLDRNTQLVNRNTVARTVVEDAQTAFDIAEADVAAARSALSKAELELSYTRISAPISGRIGQPAFTVGNFVDPNSGAIARLVQVDPIRVTFSASEADIVTMHQKGLENGRTDRDGVDIALILPNNRAYAPPGRLEFIGPEVDPRTGTAAVRSIFPNPDGLLAPGQFVRVNLRDASPDEGPVVPQTAVLQDRQGRFVYVVGQDDVARQRRIDTGVKLGDGWHVRQGMQPGEKVVVQGAQRLSDGVAVQVVSEAAGDRP
ncbi:efflux RND transporter periplasmic adaptor subunit [Pseudochelatococcus lubricantis]|uniref:efflux RND transporter periplasmic adaptor subunit n=1 Tax=Pseudochelatococcus lubricantis TaxID=1538102 RepID=UPI0035E75C86